jgi:hypothetical protein
MRERDAVHERITSRQVEVVRDLDLLCFACAFDTWIDITVLNVVKDFSAGVFVPSSIRIFRCSDHSKVLLG